MSGRSARPFALSDHLPADCLPGPQWHHLGLAKGVRSRHHPRPFCDSLCPLVALQTVKVSSMVATKPSESLGAKHVERSSPARSDVPGGNLADTNILVWFENESRQATRGERDVHYVGSSHTRRGIYISRGGSSTILFPETVHAPGTIPV